MTDVIRIVARAIQWPGIKDKPERQGLRLRWDAMTEGGELLYAATEYPLHDGAHVLVSRHGVDPAAMVTMRHEGSVHDSFVPMPIGVRLDKGPASPAEVGAKRAANRARLALIPRGVSAKDGI